MKNLEYYLNKAINVTGSDRQTALKICVTPQYLSKSRKSGFISEPAIIKLGEIINVDVAEIFLSMQADKTHDITIKKAVTKFLDKIDKNVAASFFLALLLVPEMFHQCILC